MLRTELHFVIGQQGEIQSTIKGAKGNCCKDIMSDVRELGEVTRESYTHEYFETQGCMLLHTNLIR